MKRIMFVVLACGALMAAAPATTLARSHHKRGHHKRHHARARHRSFGHDPTPGDPTPTSAGTVTSFMNGVLTITLKNGSTVSGQVTSDTELECRSATMPPPTPTGEDENGGGGDQGGGGDHGGGGDQGDGDGDGGTSCTTAALVPNTPVAEAELKLGSSGAVWEKVELITP